MELGAASGGVALGSPFNEPVVCGAVLRMPEARFELARGCPRWILSPLRLPFRHSGARERYTLPALHGQRDRAR